MEADSTTDTTIPFETLHERYAHFFEKVKQIRPRCDCLYFMSFDAEWYEDPTDPNRNIVLSYQVATASQEGTNNVIEYMEHGQRLTLAEIVELGIRSVTSVDALNRLRGIKTQVILISHNVAAEWSVLNDRDESHITKRISLVRGSPITDNLPIKLDINDDTPIDVRIFDTILLAPMTHRSLKKLSTLIGEGKEDIAQSDIENMHLYLRNQPDEFEKYALKDSEVTLKLFFVLQQSLNDLVIGLADTTKWKRFKLFRTLAAAGVKSFTNNNSWFSKYRKELPQDFSKPFQLVPRSYYGGRNESYFIGRTNDYPETKNKIWIDIDFSGCYPTAMALSPKIDLEGDADYIPRTYVINDQTAAELVADNTPADLIEKLRKALATSVEAFDQEMMQIKSKKISWRIREKASVYDNRLVDSWYRRWKTAKLNSDDPIEKVSIPGFARIRFKFPLDTQFPCLPIRHEKYGLLYVLEGETTVPAAEIMLAMEAGAEIKALTSVELPILGGYSQPDTFIMNHLAVLANKRSEYKKSKEADGPVMEKLVKEFTNSFYGKFSQSINPRKVFSPATGEMVTLGESTITEPCTAALTTSLARAALSATLLGVERFNKKRSLSKRITVISATTDGLLIGVPVPENFTVVDDYYESNPLKLKDEVSHQLPEILNRFGCSDLLNEIDAFLPIRQMRHSRMKMTGSDEILEIKHVADEIISIKTRGQIGKVSTDKTVLIARFNLKPPLSELLESEEYKKIMDAGGIDKDTEDAKWILDQLNNIENDNSIPTYPFITLNRFTKISKSQGKIDLTKNVSQRKINTDFDWKRKMVGTPGNESTVSPFTIPHQNQAEMIRYRNAMEAIRRTGNVARPQEVLHRLTVKGRSVNARGGEPVAVTRLFLRGLVHNIFALQKELSAFSVSAEQINTLWKLNRLTESYPKTWTKDDFKRARNATWEPGCFVPTITLKNLVRDLAVEFTAEPDAVEAAIFAADEFKEINSTLIEYAITALFKAPRIGISPFYELHKKGLLPGWQDILNTFTGQLTEDHLNACLEQPYIPGKLAATNSKSLKKIFLRLGLSNSDSEACTMSLAPPSRVTKGIRKNRGEKRCTNHFIQAILQDDTSNREVKVYEVLSKLKKYGATRNGYYQLKSGKFNPNCIKNTPENRQQITKMAKALGHDPLPLLDVLIEK